jgi:hypothetical protein
MERDRVIVMTDEEAQAWIHECKSDSREFIRRYNVVHWDCGLTRFGLDITRPIRCGELICTGE